MQRVLITGVGGFLGRNCLPLLAGAGEVHAVVRPGAAEGAADQATPMRVHGADLLDPTATEALVAEVRASHLLHLAWVSTRGNFWTAPENRAWMDASLHLLRVFAANGGRRAVLAGSCAEYDWTAGPCHEERTPLKPASLYGECKNALREAAEAFARTMGLSLAWARLFFLYGPHEHARRLAPTVIRGLLQGRPVVCSPGRQRRDYLYTADAAGALLALLHSNVCGAVNIGSGKAVPVRSLVRRLATICGRPDLVQLTASDPNAAPLVTADVSRLHEEVGWRPRFDLEEGLTQTVQWWRRQLGEMGSRNQ